MRAPQKLIGGKLIVDSPKGQSPGRRWEGVKLVYANPNGPRRPLRFLNGSEFTLDLDGRLVPVNVKAKP